MSTPTSTSTRAALFGMTNRRQVCRTLAASLAVASFCTFAQSDGASFPNRPIRLLVGYAPGGSQDLIARLVARDWSAKLGQPIVVENRPGAGATVATAAVARSTADGYTLLLSETSQVSIAPHTHKKLSYDSLTDFTPIGMVGSGPMVLITTSPSLRTLKDLERAAKAQPAKLNYASLGIGSVHHMVMEVLKANLGISITHVPYKGGAQSVPALLSGEVDVLFTSLATLGSVRDRVNILGVTSAQGFPLVPDVQPIPGIDFSSDSGVMAPAGLPRDVAAKLTTTLREVVSSQSFAASLKSLNLWPNWMDPVDYSARVKSDIEKYARATKLAGIQPE